MSFSGPKPEFTVWVGMGGIPDGAKQKSNHELVRVLSKQALHYELNINEMCAYIVATRNI